jgi:hypothetical protein
MRLKAQEKGTKRPKVKPRKCSERGKRKKEKKRKEKILTFLPFLFYFFFSSFQKRLGNSNSIFVEFEKKI